VKDKEELIYDLIFSEKLEYKIDIADYVDDIYQYDDFVEDMKIFENLCPNRPKRLIQNSVKLIAFLIAHLGACLE
jgi:hypothetical protein